MCLAGRGALDKKMIFLLLLLKFSTVSSDIKLKTNIEDIKYGLDDVLKLRGVDFDWKREDRGHDVGFIAQEVQEVIPELVKEVDSIGKDVGNTHLTVDYAKVVPILVESIKELKLLFK